MSEPVRIFLDKDGKQIKIGDEVIYDCVSYWRLTVVKTHDITYSQIIKNDYKNSIVYIRNCDTIKIPSKIRDQFLMLKKLEGYIIRDKEGRIL